ncbi:cation diffusion facilitator family transporter [Eubacterium oxidoreducens]|uniref:Cation diffusion facilitator family transporter n=1 Tax=Eubacterium oxidoreducens TaxID=1732 RepID=A0A1G6AEY2_EUBOX|nr:cation diffusion facilitator family transporter [Eubacterium oxidoreducens]SDB06977.1 cation diffusion facilitator family transporter [Eubacterium oxidoreducens]
MSVSEVLDSKKKRNQTIVKTSILGIMANVLLAAFKATIGIMTHSIAITMDAVNNISDAASSLITIVGTKLASKRPDRTHPFGHGRAEYLSALVISVIVLYAGVASLKESIEKIIHPDMPDYTSISLIIVAVAVVVKLLLGQYVKKVGIKVNSDSLINSGEDARLDAVISAATLAAAVIYLIFNISLEAYLAAIISIVIVKTGIDMIREALSRILGERADVELASNIKALVNSYPDVSGSYDLVLNNYGPNAYNGSIHIEVPDTYSANELDKLIRRITMDVYAKYDVILTAIGVYSVNTKDQEAIAIREHIREIVMEHEHVLQMHGFYLDKEEMSIRFDVVISFDALDREQVYEELVGKIKPEYPDYSIQMQLDTDFSESDK